MAAVFSWRNAAPLGKGRGDNQDEDTLPARGALQEQSVALKRAEANAHAQKDGFRHLRPFRF